MIRDSALDAENLVPRGTGWGIRVASPDEKTAAERIYPNGGVAKWSLETRCAPVAVWRRELPIDQTRGWPKVRPGR